MQLCLQAIKCTYKMNSLSVYIASRHTYICPKNMNHNIKIAATNGNKVNTFPCHKLFYFLVKPRVDDYDLLWDFAWVRTVMEYKKHVRLDGCLVYRLCTFTPVWPAIPLYARVCQACEHDNHASARNGKSVNTQAHTKMVCVLLWHGCVLEAYVGLSWKPLDEYVEICMVFSTRLLKFSLECRRVRIESRRQIHFSNCRWTSQLPVNMWVKEFPMVIICLFTGMQSQTSS